MNRNNRLVLPAYVIAFALIAAPLLDLGVSAWPPRFGSLQWRFGVGGMASTTLMTPLLGAFVALVVAVLFEHRSVLRMIAVVVGLGTVALMIMMVLFALDTLQMRPTVKPELQVGFLKSAAVAFSRHGLLLICSAALSFTSIRVLRRIRESRKAPAPIAPIVTGKLPDGMRGASELPNS